MEDEQLALKDTDRMEQELEKTKAGAVVPHAASAQSRVKAILTAPIALKIIGGVVLLAIWQVAVHELAPAYVATPIGIAKVFWPVVTSADFLSAAWSTIRAVLEGLALCLVTGAIFGMAIGRSKLMHRIFGHYVYGMYAMPMVAILPPLTLWFGYTQNARLALIILVTFVTIVINVADGARHVPREYMEVAHMFQAKRRHIWFDVTLMSSLPYLLAGIRLSIGRAIVAAVLAEFFTSIGGLGYFILLNARSYEDNTAFVAILLLGALGVFLESSMKWIVRFSMPWYGRSAR